MVLRSIKHSEIDKMFKEFVSSLYDINIADTTLNEYGKNNEILYLDNKILKYESKLLTLENQFNEDCLSLEQYQMQTRRTNKKISDLRENRDILINDNINLNLIDKEIIKLSFDNFSTVWNQISSEYKKNFIERFISEIEFDNDIMDIILSK